MAALSGQDRADAIAAITAVIRGAVGVASVTDGSVNVAGVAEALVATIESGGFTITKP